MVIFGSHMFEFCVRKDMKKIKITMIKYVLHGKGAGIREGSGTFMFNTDCQRIGW